MNTIFKQIRRQGKTLLVLPTDDRNVAIVGDDGSFYGTFFTIESFDRFMKAHGSLESNRLGYTRVSHGRVERAKVDA